MEQALTVQLRAESLGMPDDEPMPGEFSNVVTGVGVAILRDLEVDALAGNAAHVPDHREARVNELDRGPVRVKDVDEAGGSRKQVVLEKVVTEIRQLPRLGEVLLE